MLPSTGVSRNAFELTEFTEAGILMEVSAVAPVNTESPIDASADPFSKMTEVNDGVVARAKDPNDCTEAGIVIVVKFGLVRKVLAPIDVILAGVSKETDVIPEVQNAPEIFVTPLGITTLISPVP
jgi:hypothetical protein